jgi:hypothetical protein
VVAFSPSGLQGAPTAEASLASALDRAAAAGQWGIVAQLAGELEARRLFVTEVTSIEEARARRRVRP